MRAPLPLLGALVVALAAVYYVTVQTETTHLVINATSLRPGENMTLTLNYLPRQIELILNSSDPSYHVVVTAPGVEFEVLARLKSGPMMRYPYIVYERYEAWYYAPEPIIYEFRPVKVGPGPVKVEIFIERLSGR